LHAPIARPDVGFDPMETTSAFAARALFRKLATEPLSLGETAIVAIAFFAGGTIYCQLYCLIAFQQMQGMAMPLSLSMQQSAVETFPALAAFELSKRALRDPSAVRRFTGIAITYALAAGLTVAALLLLQPLGYARAMPLRLMVADFVPGLTLTAVGILWAEQQKQLRIGPAYDGGDDPAIAGMPPHQRIDWVQAAGNYVEVHFGGRTRIVRMTLRQALAALGADRFVQVHRSVLVNRDRILDRARRRSQVELADGTVLKVGDSYRAQLSTNDGARLVPSSHSIGQPQQSA
jgi:hypothetical protein